MRNITYIISFIVLIFTNSISAPASTGIRDVRFNTKILTVYDLLEVTVYLDKDKVISRSYSDISVSADIKTPTNDHISVNAFPSGKGWKIRYTPTEIGDHAINVLINNTAQNAGQYNFKVKNGNNTGFLHKNHENNFVNFDDGSPFFGIGFNVCWVSNNDPKIYRNYFKKMSENGCNLTRIWINTPWGFDLENTKLGVYDQDTSEKIDSVLALAKEYNIYIIFVIDTYGSLMPESGHWGEGGWQRNPYNKNRGGPCHAPEDFFTDKNAREHYKNRLNYIISRWGYSPNILAFEFWNEKYSPLNWLHEMSDYFKDNDINKHLLTTSLPSSVLPKNQFSTWNTRNIDIVQYHVYGNNAQNLPEYLSSSIIDANSKFNKPILIGEFGLDSFQNDKNIDRAGYAVGLHNSLWITSLSGSFSTPLNWWWAGYIHAKDLYSHYDALNRYLGGTDWNSMDLSFLRTSMVKHLHPKPVSTYSKIVINTVKTWGDTEHSQFRLRSNGKIIGGPVNYYLHGKSKKDLKTAPTFNVSFPTKGKFQFHIDKVSQGANIRVYLDGNIVKRIDLPAGEGKGKWLKSFHIKEYDIYQCIYDLNVSIDIPAGKHTIKLENTGLDWAGIDSITFDDLKSDIYANVDISGLQIGTNSLFWIYNRENTWENILNGNKASRVNNIYFEIFDLENGKYSLEWWDTYKGTVIKRSNIEVRANTARLIPPSFTRDIAGKLIKR